MSKSNVTIKDIAEKCGVSIATVSRVMNNVPGRYSAQTEAEIRNVAKELGYVPNIMARSLVTRKTGLVAVLIPDIHYYFYQELYTGLEDYFKGHNIRPILCSTLESVEREKQYIESMSNGLVDGMVISTLNNQENNNIILKLRKQGFPIVKIARYRTELEDCCNVRGNNILSGEMAVDYLVANGHRDIAFIGGPNDAKNSALRFSGYLKGMKKHALKIDKNLIANADYKFENNIFSTAKIIQEQKFTALIAANDLICVGVHNMLKRNKRKVPGEVSLIGLDNTAFMERNHPALTAVSFRGVELGICAARCLKELIDGQNLEQMEYIIDPVINIGKSVQDLRK